ncbi:MAG: hypothetical protein U0871_13540 [Gemmataceae bacterium]
MTPTPAPPRRVRTLAAVAFWPLLAVWTWKLLEPYPVPEGVREYFGLWQFLAAKTLHFVGYATLAGLAWLQATTYRGRVLAVAAVVAHGGLTELLQHLLPFNRYGCWRDTGLDAAGALTGALVTYLVWRYALPRSRPDPA